MVENPPAVETKPKVYSYEDISRLLMSGQAKTVTEAKAILQAEGYISPLQAFKGEAPKPLVPPEAKNVKYEFRPSEKEIETGKISPLLPRGSTLVVTYELPKPSPSVSSPTSITTKSIIEQKQPQLTPQAAQPSSYTPPKTIMEQQAEKLIETTQKIQTLGGILETKPSEVGTPLSFAKSVGRGIMSIVSYPFLVGGIVGHTIFGLQYYPKETQEKFLGRIPKELPSAIVGNVQQYVQAWKEQPVEMAGETTGQLLLAYGIHKAIQYEAGTKAKPEVQLSSTKEIKIGKETASSTKGVIINPETKEKIADIHILTKGEEQPVAVRVGEGIYRTFPEGKFERFVAGIKPKEGKPFVIRGVAPSGETWNIVEGMIKSPEQEVIVRKGGIITEVKYFTKKVPIEKITKQELISYLKEQTYQPSFSEALKAKLGLSYYKSEIKPSLYRQVEVTKTTPVELGGIEVKRAVSGIFVGEKALGEYKSYEIVPKEKFPFLTIKGKEMPTSSVLKDLAEYYKTQQLVEQTKIPTPTQTIAEEVAKTAVKPEVTPTAAFTVGATSVLPETKPTGFVKLEPTLTPTKTETKEMSIVKPEEAYFSKVGTPYMKEEVEQRVVTVKPELSQQQVEALMIKQMQMEKQLQEQIIKPVRVEQITPIEKQMQFEKTMEKLAQMQIKQAQATRPRVVPTTQTYGFRVYPPYLPFKVIRGQQRQGGKMVRKNVWEYFERQWGILGMHEFAKLFTGKGKKK